MMLSVSPVCYHETPANCTDCCHAVCQCTNSLATYGVQSQLGVQSQSASMHYIQNIRRSGSILCCSLQGEYHMYVAQTPHIDPLMFHLALQQNAETDAVDGAEKTAFAW